MCGLLLPARPAGEQWCEDINECLATNIGQHDEKCACERCACINTPGSYK